MKSLYDKGASVEDLILATYQLRKTFQGEIKEKKKASRAPTRFQYNWRNR